MWYDSVGCVRDRNENHVRFQNERIAVQSPTTKKATRRQGRKVISLSGHALLIIH